MPHTDEFTQSVATTTKPVFALQEQMRGEDSFEQNEDLYVNGTPCLRTVFTPYDPTVHHATYKPYTHILDFAGVEPITKGIGGVDSHHRGMFIGWSKVRIGKQCYDFWHMKGVSQRHARWLRKQTGRSASSHTQEVLWCDPDGQTVIREERTIGASAGSENQRVFDFVSVLESQNGVISLGGGVHHAGMHVRMANEVFWRPWTTRYIVPEGAHQSVNNEVTGGWWVCCSCVVSGIRYWLVFMAHPELLAGQPRFSVRRYGRFGASIRQQVAQGISTPLQFRVIMSDHALNRAACHRLFQAYSEADMLFPAHGLYP